MHGSLKYSGNVGVPLLLIIITCLPIIPAYGNEREATHHHLYTQALTHVENNELHEAYELLKQVVREAPDYYQAYALLVNIHTEQNELPQLKSYFQSILPNTTRPEYCYRALGLIDTRLGRYDDAIMNFIEALNVTVEYYPVYKDLGDVYRLCTADKRSALDKYLKTLRKEYRNNEFVLYGSAYFAYRSFDLTGAEMMMEDCIKKQPLIGEWHALLGIIHRIRGDYSKALHYFNQSLIIAGHKADMRGQGEALSHIGSIYHLRSKYAQALEYYRRALKMARALLDKTGEGNVLNNMGKVYSDRSQYAEALHYYEKSLSIRELIGDRYGCATTLSNTGAVFAMLSDYPKALEYFFKACDMKKIVGDKNGEAHTLNNIGALYWYLCDYKKALDYYRRSLDIRKEIDNKAGEGYSLYNIGTVFYDLGEYEQALEFFKQSLAIQRKIGDKTGEGYSLNSIGFLAKSDKTYPGLPYYRKALSILNHVGDKQGTAEVLNNIGDVYYDTERYTKALECYKKSLRIHTGIDDKEGRAENLAKIGNTCYRMKDYTGALRYLNESITVTEDIRRDLRYEKHKVSFMRNRMFAYDTMIELLFAMHEQTPLYRYDQRGFMYAQKCKSRALLDLLEESRVNVTQGVAPRLKKKEQELNQRYSRINVLLQEALAKQEGSRVPAEVGRLMKMLADVDNELDVLHFTMTRENPSYAALRYPGIMTVREVRETLIDDKTLLLEYKVTNDAVYAWRISGTGCDMVKMPVSRDVLIDKVNAVRTCVTRRLDAEIYYDTAYDLYKSILMPLLDGTGEDYERLLIVPDDILHYLPFEILVTENSYEHDGTMAYGKLPFVIHKYTLNYVSSVGVAKMLKNRSMKREPVKFSFDLLAMGDPWFNHVMSDTRDIYLNTTLRSSGGGTLTRLVNSGYEVKNIGWLFERSVVRVGKEAKESYFKCAEGLKGFKYIHLASHGLINEDNPGFSGIVLARDDDSAEDGFLQMREIAHLEVDADLVVLSACRTGLGKLVRAEGVMSLARSWLYAGASSVLVSLWNVDDESTAAFMIRFYRNLDEGMTKGEALREAKLWLMGYDKYSWPYYWAGFVLIGED